MFTSPVDHYKLPMGRTVFGAKPGRLRKFLAGALIAALSQWAVAQTVFEDANVVEALASQFIAGLAKNQSFTLLAAPTPGDAQPGSLYSVGPPSNCSGDLQRATQAGTPVVVNRLEDLPPPLGGNNTSGQIKEWRNVRIDSFIGDAAKAAIAAKTGKAEAEISAAIKSLSQSNAQVSFGKFESASYPLRRAAEQYLRANAITDVKQMAADGTGIVVPYAQLVFQKFVFESTLVRGADVNLVAQFLEFFKLRVQGSDTRVRGATFTLPTNAVFAFKYEPMLFACR